MLSHSWSDGTEKPIGFVSRTLTETEKKYSQLEKEALSCILDVARFDVFVLSSFYTPDGPHAIGGDIWRE